jgi:hypothetical protein
MPFFKENEIDLTRLEIGIINVNGKKIPMMGRILRRPRLDSVGIRIRASRRIIPANAPNAISGTYHRRSEAFFEYPNSSYAS